MLTSDDIFLDFECRSAAPLGGTKGVGSWKYSLHPTTKVLCLAYASGMDDPLLWVDGQPPPKLLMEAIGDKCRVHGWNSMSFERAIFHNVCVPKLGWREPDPDQYHDTMLDALTLSLPAKLEDCCKALKTYNKKMEDGKRLITLLCKPIASGKKKGQFREREEFLQDYTTLYYYCKQDVRTERDVYCTLPRHLDGIERDRALLVMAINERGLHIDTGLVDCVLEGLEYDTEIQYEKFESLTGIPKPTQREKFMAWLATNGLVIPDMTAETMSQLDLTKGNDTATGRKINAALRVYLDSKSSSTAKFKKIRTMICDDNTVKNNLIFNKANTGRLAGAGFQAQNLPNVHAEYTDSLIDLFADKEYDFITLLCGMQKAAKLMIRKSLRARPGKKFLSGDLKGVEARGTSYIANEHDVLANFRMGIDAYVSSASGMYGVHTDMVTKDQRQAGKIAVLSGGFGGGYRALLKMAAKMGMHMTEQEARKIIRDFRRGRPKLVKTWLAFAEAAMEAVASGRAIKVEGTGTPIYFKRDGIWLYMILPSGRRLSFPYPEIREEPFFGRMQTNVTAMWVNSLTHTWTRRTITGANFFQSAVQAFCRDLLFHTHDLVEDEGYPLVLSVHDEGVSEVPDDPSYSIERYQKLMETCPPWALDFPLEADCWEDYRYRK